MLQDPVQRTVEGAKDQLTKAVSTTATAEGNPTASFGPHEFSESKYNIPRGVRKKKQ